MDILITKEQAIEAVTQWFNEEFDDELLQAMVRQHIIGDAAIFKATGLANLTTIIEDISGTDVAFVPDWDNIKYDWLAMDEDGEWYSYENEPTLDGDVGNDCWWGKTGKCNREEKITYQHPDYTIAYYFRYVP